MIRLSLIVAAVLGAVSVHADMPISSGTVKEVSCHQIPVVADAGYLVEVFSISTADQTGVFNHADFRVDVSEESIAGLEKVLSFPAHMNPMPRFGAPTVYQGIGMYASSFQLSVQSTIRPDQNGEYPATLRLPGNRGIINTQLKCRYLPVPL